MYGEGIIERLHPDCQLRNTGNPGRSVLLGTVGALLDEYDIVDIKNAPFLDYARGSYLDCHGVSVNVKRRLGESDDDYRQRLVFEVLGYLTRAYLLSVYDLVLYVNVADFDPSENTLTSDNPYITGDGFMSIASEDVQSVLESKFIIGEEIVWLTL